MTAAQSFSWNAVTLTETGKVRKHNEDALMDCSDRGHWAVADGMGGHDAGDVASQLVVSMLGEVEVQFDAADTIDGLEDRLIEANRQLRVMAGRRDRIIGTTVAGLFLFQHLYLLYWCGDSRVYLYRNGRLSLETVDHTYVQSLIEQGALHPEDADNHPDKNMITRAVGAADTVYIDMDMRNLQASDRFLICSDGLDKELSEEEIGNFMARRDCSLQELAGSMMKTCLDRAGRDNTTLILIDIIARS